MRSFYVLFASIVLSICAFVPSVDAVTVLQFNPQQVTVQEGEKIHVTVQALPVDTTNYTVKLVTQFSSDVLEVFSWSYANEWLPLRKDGYDALDNDAGILIRTAGYPSGFDAPIVFGTITFRAKKAGTATISVTNESLVLDAENKNVMAIGPPTKVTVQGAVIEEPVAPVEVVHPPVYTAPETSQQQPATSAQPTQSNSSETQDENTSLEAQPKQTTSSASDTVHTSTAQEEEMPTALTQDEETQMVDKEKRQEQVLPSAADTSLPSIKSNLLYLLIALLSIVFALIAAIYIHKNAKRGFSF